MITQFFLILKVTVLYDSYDQKRINDCPNLIKEQIIINLTFPDEHQSTDSLQFLRLSQFSIVPPLKPKYNRTQTTPVCYRQQ